jgi:asparagine synthase (glutamine-hydrolysing)
MCGIAGLIRFDGLTPADYARAARLKTLLRHRGPDGSGIASDAHAVLIQTRLALIAPEPHPLPLQSSDGRFTLVYNGEVYNHQELRTELAESYEFRTRSDTEVVLAALIHWGPTALSRFEGMFALFLWDRDQHAGLVAVDPLSVKPLLYHSTESHFAFCSEAGPLIATGVVPFRPHEEAIAEYLTAPYFSGSHLLPFSNLQRLLPGHYLQLANGRVNTSRYRVNLEPPPALLPALKAAVAAQLVADAGVGLFLSGGVDSSLLAALVPKPLPAFTIDYDHGPEHFVDSLIVKSDDVPFARKVATRYRHPLHLVNSPNFEAALMRTLQTNDLIAAWEQEVSQNLLAEAAAPIVKAVLVGDVADETHFGYSFLLHPERLTSPQHLLDYFGHLPTRLGPAHFVEKYRAFTRAEGHSWHTSHDQRLAISCLIRHFWLTRLLHNGDIHLMAHSVEGRVPYAHPAVLAYGDEVFPSDALKNGIEKYHLRRAAAERLPAEIAWRPKSALTKHMDARQTIHRLFRQAWLRHGALIEPYVVPDAIDNLKPPTSDRESGLRFRLLALLTWFARFAESG